MMQSQPEAALDKPTEVMTPGKRARSTSLDSPKSKDMTTSPSFDNELRIKQRRLRPENEEAIRKVVRMEEEVMEDESISRFFNEAEATNEVTVIGQEVEADYVTGDDEPGRNENETAGMNHGDIDKDQDWQGLGDLAKMVNLAISTALEKAIKPMREEMERNAEAFSRQIDRMHKEIIELKAMTTKPPNKVALMSELFKEGGMIATNNVMDRNVTINPFGTVNQSNGMHQNTATLDVQLAKRSMGFFPIKSEDIDVNLFSCSEGKSKVEKHQQASVRTIQNFISNEMGMPDSAISQLNFVRVFYPPSGSGANTLYAEFGSEEDIALVRRYASNLTGNDRLDPKTVLYIPKSLQKEHNDMQQVAYAARRLVPKMSSKIWFGKKMELRLKLVGDRTPWLNIKPVNINHFWAANPVINHMAQPKQHKLASRKKKNLQEENAENSNTDISCEEKGEEDMDTASSENNPGLMKKRFNEYQSNYYSPNRYKVLQDEQYP